MSDDSLQTGSENRADPENLKATDPFSADAALDGLLDLWLYTWRA